MAQTRTRIPLAVVKLRAYGPAPARVELVERTRTRRIGLALLYLGLCWGAVPLLLWIPPHYPWVAGAIAAGVFLCHREWTGRYGVVAFAGICPRCSAPLSMGVDRLISLPHTLTCYHCHFEPTLEVVREAPGRDAEVRHRDPDCTGGWREVWLADQPFVLCMRCHAHAPSTAAVRARAAAENESARLLRTLTDEGDRLR